MGWLGKGGLSQQLGVGWVGKGGLSQQLGVGWVGKGGLGQRLGVGKGGLSQRLGVGWLGQRLGGYIFFFNSNRRTCPSWSFSRIGISLSSGSEGKSKFNLKFPLHVYTVCTK